MIIIRPEEIPPEERRTAGTSSTRELVITRDEIEPRRSMLPRLFKQARGAGLALVVVSGVGLGIILILIGAVGSIAGSLFGHIATTQVKRVIAGAAQPLILGMVAVVLVLGLSIAEVLYAMKWSLDAIQVGALIMFTLLGAWMGWRGRPQLTRIPYTRAAPIVLPATIFKPSGETASPGSTEAGLACPFCGGVISAGTAKTCASCKTLHHQECWNENGGCTTRGCPQNPSIHT